jgi:hypothetical protein
VISEIESDAQVNEWSIPATTHRLEDAMGLDDLRTCLRHRYAGQKSIASTATDSHVTRMDRVSTLTWTTLQQRYVYSKDVGPSQDHCWVSRLDQCGLHSINVSRVPGGPLIQHPLASSQRETV